MTERVILSQPLGDLHEVDVLVGAPTIETATGLRPDETRELCLHDKTAIHEAMRA